MRSPITTHVLDTSIGKPAAGIKVVLSYKNKTEWQEQNTGITDADGRIETLVTLKNFKTGIYKLDFSILSYCQKNNRETFYPSITVCFSIKDITQHYHVPLLFNDFGYTTYRGS